MAKAAIGISGWRYEPWRGTFYPRGLAQRRELLFASRHFASIELNGSFYSLQTPDSYAQWHAETPEDFVFAVKGPRYLTHMIGLAQAQSALPNFFASGLFALRAKLGPFLWQLPPRMRFDAERLRRFLGELPRTTAEAARIARRYDARAKGRVLLDYEADRPLRHALEVRHESFRDEAFIALLREQCVAAVVADTAGRWPCFEDVTADFLYLRLHGDTELYASGYSDTALDHWAARIRSWTAGAEPIDAQRISAPAATALAGRDLYCYFDNDQKVMAPVNAASLMAKLGQRRAAPEWPSPIAEAPRRRGGIAMPSPRSKEKG